MRIVQSQWRSGDSPLCACGERKRPGSLRAGRLEQMKKFQKKENNRLGKGKGELVIDKVPAKTARKEATVL